MHGSIDGVQPVHKLQEQDHEQFAASFLFCRRRRRRRSYPFLFRLWK